MKKIFFVLTLVLSVFYAMAQGEKDQLFEQANAQYQRQEYTNAIDNYLKIIALGYESVELYYNLANAYYKTGKVAQSIYYYEKAQQLQPTDADIQTNKKFAEQMMLDKITPLPQIGIGWVKQFLMEHFSLQTMSLLSIGSTWILAIFAGVYYFSKKSLVKKIFFAGTIFYFFISLSVLFFGYFVKTAQNTPYAILFENSVKMYSEPSEHSQEIRTLHQGTKVEIQENFSSWSKIRLANGQSGWVKQHIYKEL